MEPFVGYSDYLRIIPFALEPELATYKCFACMPLQLVLLINSWLLFFFVFVFVFFLPYRGGTSGGYGGAGLVSL